MDWLVIGGFLVGAAILLYAFLNREGAPQPSQRGLFVGTGLALIATGVWRLWQQFGPQLETRDLLSAFFLLVAVMLCGSMVRFFFLRKSAGNLVKEIRQPMSKRVSGLVTAGIFALLATFTLYWGEYAQDRIAELVFYVAVMLYFSSPFFGKVEIRQNGLIESYMLIRWKSILSYTWAGRDESTLIINIRSRWQRKGVLLINPGQKPFVDALLNEHITGVNTPALVS